MKHINDENIDEIMFQLLEGEIIGPEREQLLSAIEADDKYRKLWNAWQQTILSPAGEDVSMNISGLKKKTGRIIPFNYKYAIAAMLVLGLGLAIFLVNREPGGPGIVSKPKPKKTTQPVLQVPKPEIKTPYDSGEDSARIPLKEKIRTIALDPSGLQIEMDTVYPVYKKIDRIQKNPETFIAQNPEPERLPVKHVEPIEDPNRHIIVTMSSDTKTSAMAVPADKKESLLARLFGKPKFKLENDSTTKTNKRLIIENKQYRIIAGF